MHGAGLMQVTSMEECAFDIIDLEDFDHDAIHFLDGTFDPCEVSLQWIQRLIVHAEANQIIKVAPPILSRVYNQLGNGIVKLCEARKIAKFSIPFPFAQMVTIMLLTHWVMAAVVCATSIESRVWSTLLSFAVILSFWSINYIALELEDPFGDDANDLPLHDMQKDLNKSIKELLQPHAMKIPPFNFCAEYHDELLIKTVDFNKNLFNDVKRCADSRPKDAHDSAIKRVAAKKGDLGV